MKSRAEIIMAAVFIVAVMLSPMPAPAETAAEGKDPKAWQFEFTPYFFAAGLNGKTGVNNITADVDMSFDDIFKNLDSGFMALFEARKGPWSFGIEGVYFKLKDEKANSWEGPLGNSSTSTLDATMTEQLYSFRSVTALQTTA